ncbi:MULTISPECIES: high light inducible protein [Aphanothece]|uniref:high light inducible protein n=1 Tax=Aphanothece TaxID=1121 RepID=UPI0039846199
MAPAEPESPGQEPASQPVSRTELNAWRRGFTPQAEIWNGRLAMLGLSVGLAVLLLARLAIH